MIEQGKDCEEILAQLAAVKSALERVGTHLISHHMKDCLEDTTGAQLDPDALERAFDVFFKYVQCMRSSGPGASSAAGVALIQQPAHREPVDGRVVLGARVGTAGQSHQGGVPGQVSGQRQGVRQRDHIVSPGVHQQDRARHPGGQRQAVLPAEVVLEAGDIPAGRAAAAPRRPRSGVASRVSGIVVDSSSAVEHHLARSPGRAGPPPRSRPSARRLEAIEPAHARTPVADARPIDARMLRAGSRPPQRCRPPAARRPRPHCRRGRGSPGPGPRTPGAAASRQKSSCRARRLPAPWPTTRPGSGPPPAPAGRYRVTGQVESAAERSRRGRWSAGGPRSTAHRRGHADGQNRAGRARPLLR